MKTKIKLFITGSLLLSVSLFGFLKWINPPLPQYKGKIKISSLIDSVHVYTDSYGVPHIFANNEKDLFFTAGYLAAIERLF